MITGAFNKILLFSSLHFFSCILQKSKHESVRKYSNTFQTIPNFHKLNNDIQKKVHTDFCVFLDVFQGSLIHTVICYHSRLKLLIRYEVDTSQTLLVKMKFIQWKPTIAMKIHWNTRHLNCCIWCSINPTMMILVHVTFATSILCCWKLKCGFFNEVRLKDRYKEVAKVNYLKKVTCT